jgi:hypothetical protein
METRQIVCVWYMATASGQKQQFWFMLRYVCISRRNGMLVTVCPYCRSERTDIGGAENGNCSLYAISHDTQDLARSA